MQESPSLRLVVTSTLAAHSFPPRLRQFLESRFKVEIRNAYELVGKQENAVTLTGFDVVLAHLGDGSAQAFEMLENIASAIHPLPVVAICDGDGQRVILNAIRAGAQDGLSLHPNDEQQWEDLYWTLCRTSERIRRHRLHDELTLGQESAEAMVILDRQGRVQFLNEEAAQLLGHPAAKLMGAPFPFALSACPQNSEVSIERPDGTQRDAEIRMVETEWGTKPARIVSLNDITLRRKLEGALQRTENARHEAKTRGQNLFARMDRELRTPLNDILGFAELIRRESFGPVDARYQSYAAAIGHSGKKLLAIIESLDSQKA